MIEPPNESSNSNLDWWQAFPREQDPPPTLLVLYQGLQRLTQNPVRTTTRRRYTPYIYIHRTSLAKGMYIEDSLVDSIHFKPFTFLTQDQHHQQQQQQQQQGPHMYNDMNLLYIYIICITNIVRPTSRRKFKKGPAKSKWSEMRCLPERVDGRVVGVLIVVDEWC